MVSSSLPSAGTIMTASWKWGSNTAPSASISLTPKSSRIFTSCFCKSSKPCRYAAPPSSFFICFMASSKLSSTGRKAFRVAAVWVSAAFASLSRVRRRKLSKSACKRTYWAMQVASFDSAASALFLASLAAFKASVASLVSFSTSVSSVGFSRFSSSTFSSGVSTFFSSSFIGKPPTYLLIMYLIFAA